MTIKHPAMECTCKMYDRVVNTRNNMMHIKKNVLDKNQITKEKSLQKKKRFK